jgi:uncharacterized repeat protein (TIGR02543 family)
MATIAEILRMTVEERKQEYKATSIDLVKIDGNPFTDYKAFSFLWEKSYVKSPERSGDGSITNLNSYATFVTPHLKIDFSMMSIDSYRTLMTLLYEKNEHIVECYDVVRNELTVNNMYFATEEMPKLWTIARALNGEQWVELLGVQDYSVELIGTNTNFEELTLNYNLNKPSGATWVNGTTATTTFAKNTTVGIGSGAVVTVGEEKQSMQSITFGDNYIFNGWNTKADGSGINYINGDEYYLMGDTTLYAQWKSSK